MAKEVAELAKGRDPLTACRDRHQGLNEPPRPTHHRTLRVLTAADSAFAWRAAAHTYACFPNGCRRVSRGYGLHGGTCHGLRRRAPGTGAGHRAPAGVRAASGVPPGRFLFGPPGGLGCSCAHPKDQVRKQIREYPGGSQDRRTVGLAVESWHRAVNGGPMWTRLRRVKMDSPCPVVDVFQLLVVAAGTRPRSRSFRR